MHKFPVLLLDDNRRWLQICQSRLAQQSYQLETTVSYEDAIKRLDLTKYPVVISDLRLIGMARGGFALLVRAKQISEFTQVIIITAYGGAATDIAREAMEKGAVNYFTKPLDFDALDEAINMAIQSWHQEIEEMQNLGFLTDGPELRLFQRRNWGEREEPGEEFDGQVEFGDSEFEKFIENFDVGFNKDDLREICIVFKIDPENLKGETKRAKAVSLFEYCRERGTMEELRNHCQKKRNNLNW